MSTQEAFVKATGLPCALRTSSMGSKLSSRHPPKAQAIPPSSTNRVSTEHDDISDDQSLAPHPTPSLPETSMFRVDPNQLSIDAEENLRGFVKTRGSLIPGEEFVFWFSGEVYGVVDGAGSRHLFGMEGYNIGRMMRVDGGWRLVTREMAVYRKGNKNGEMLTKWTNPYTKRDDDVVHVWNDPVNQELLLDGPYGKFSVGTTNLDGSVCWNVDAFPRYESPLPASEFPEVGGGDMYEAAEMIQLFVPEAELEDESPQVTNCTLGWVRMGPWLPWMRMGDRQGRLMYHCRGRKLASFKDLPQGLRTIVEREHPEYAMAPEIFSKPNETSWSYMRKLLEQKGRPRADGRVAPAEPKTVVLAASAQTNSIKLTRRELGKFDGRDGGPVFVSVMGRVFDVSSSRRHYGAGETYHCLAGREVTAALISGDLTDDGVEGKGVDLRSLNKVEKETVEGWLSFFCGHYEEVGLLTDL